jgi:hypothetical protein
LFTAALLLSGAARAEDEEQPTKLPRVYRRFAQSDHGQRENAGDWETIC